MNHRDDEIILLVHHKPIWVDNKYNGQATKYAFETNLSHLLVNPIKVCVFGHTHENYDEVINESTRVVTNPHGLPHDKVDYKNDFVIHLN